MMKLIRNDGRVALGISFLVLFLFVASALSQRESSPQKTGYRMMEPRPGDRCIVSGKPLGPDDISLLVNGRRVPLKREALNIFLEDPEKYFSSLQPKSALFSEDMGQNAPMKLGWFLFGLYVLVGLVFAALAAHTAVAKGLSPVPWFFAGLFASAFGYLAVLAKESRDAGEIPEGLKKVPLTADPVRCDKCGNENHPSAKTCSSCGNHLTPRATSEAERAGIK